MIFACRAGRLLSCLSLLFMFTSCALLYRKIGGEFSGEPREMWNAVGPEARTLIAQAFSAIESERLMDIHVHVIGTGTSGSGIQVNPTWISFWHPIRRARTFIFLSAAGIDDLERADEQFIERLVALADAFPRGSKFFLYAMDGHYSPDGQYEPRLTPYYVPNEYVWRISQTRPDLFVPVVSVHPYRVDAIEARYQRARKGARFLKWIPNAQGIDPADGRLTSFYERMRDLGMTLLTHTGSEMAIDAEDYQQYGNPLRLRLPLNLGVRVVALHCASDGDDLDLDDPRPTRVPSFDLFMRIFDDSKYEGLLFGGLSATIFFNHVGKPLDTLLERTDLHDRLLNGSDYPLSGMNVLIQTSRLAAAGYITESQSDALSEIYRFNPLLFDFVVKRTVKHPESGRSFLPEAFMIPSAFLSTVRPAQNTQPSDRSPLAP